MSDVHESNGDAGNGARPRANSENQQVRRAWDLYKHEDDNLSARTSYGMVAQSMLVAAYAALLAIGWDKPPEAYKQWVTAVEALICSFGIWYSWRHIGMIDEVQETKRRLIREFLIDDPTFRVYWLGGAASRQGGRRDIPFVMGIGWLIFGLIAVLVGGWFPLRIP